MSPAFKSMSEDKRTGKVPTKASVKLAGSANGGGIPSSAYNPVLGSFHTLELESSSSAPVIQSDGRFRSIDGNDKLNGHSVGTGREFDASSNNGSWSGESEEHKEKSSSQSTRLESIPGAESDKREKVRQKNERKHQRQKERRAQELHEKCGGYLMSRKLEYLSQQLVAMGFSAGRATMALMVNEGKVNQSVAWLIEEGAEVAEKDKQNGQNFGANGNLKIDISEELARMADLEIRYKCSKQEVDRAVVASEGDIDKAAEFLKTQKQQPPCSLKPEESGDPPIQIVHGVRHSSTTNQCFAKTPPRPSSSTSTVSYLRDEKDFNYTRTVVLAGMLPDNGKNSVRTLLKRAQPRSDWAKPQLLVAPVAEKRWPVLGTSSQVASPVASPVQVSQQLLKAEARYAVTEGESRNTQQIGTVREPVTVLQPHSAKTFVMTSIATSTHTTVPSWHTSGGSDLSGSGGVAQIPSSKSFSSNNVSPNKLYQQQALTGNNSMDSIRHAKTNSVPSKLATSSILSPASSLGLFSGTVTPNVPSGSSSPVDWSNGYDMRLIDYANIDWSLDRSAALSLPSTQQGSLWSVGVMGLSSRNGIHVSGNGMAIPWPGPVPVSPPNGSNDPRFGLAIPTTGAMGEWSSPFEEKDMFRLPRQFVSSHSMYEDHRGI